MTEVGRRPRLGKARGRRGRGLGRLRRARHEVIQRDAKAFGEVHNAGAVVGGGQQAYRERLRAGSASEWTTRCRGAGGAGAGGGLKGALQKPQEREVERAVR